MVCHILQKCNHFLHIKATFKEYWCFKTLYGQCLCVSVALLAKNIKVQSSVHEAHAAEALTQIKQQTDSTF